MSDVEPTHGGRRRGFSGRQVALIVLVCALASALLTLWGVRSYLFPSEFEPVRLSAVEHRALEAKLERLESIEASRPKRHGAEPAESKLAPEPYAESDASREILLTEREINALIATNTDLATRAAIDLSDNLASAKLLIPVDPDVPLLGGKTLRVSAGVELGYRGGRPVVMLKGISLMGVPIPNAWLGNLKNVDLVEEFGADAGFWKAFAAGVEQLEVEEGRLKLKLRE